MDLLAEIQAAAVDPQQSVSNLLRMCQILAFRLKHEPFKEWVKHELNGYPDDATLPAYRANVAAELKAQTFGPFNSGVSGIQVPIGAIPEAARDAARRVEFSQGVAALESLVEGANERGRGTLTQPLPVEWALQTEIMEMHQTARMWKEVPINAVVGILDQVRNRALTFVLEIEVENPAAGRTSAQQAATEPPVPLARTDAIFQTVVLGGQVAIGPNASVEVSVSPGDIDSLMRYLEQVGIDDADRAELREAIEGDASEGASAQGPGKRVSAWLGRVGVKAASSSGRIGEATVASLAAAAIARFLGLA